jgi:hypothetical protein
MKATTKKVVRGQLEERVVVVRVVSGSRVKVREMIGVHVGMIVVRVVRAAGMIVVRVVSGSRVRVRGMIGVRVGMIVVRVVRAAGMIVGRVVSGSRVKVRGMIGVRVGMIVVRVVRAAGMIVVRVVSGSRVKVREMIVVRVGMIGVHAGTIVAMTSRRMKHSVVEQKCLPARDLVSTARTSRLVIVRTAKSVSLMRARFASGGLTATNVRVEMPLVASHVDTESKMGRSSRHRRHCKSPWRAKCVERLVIVAMSS